MAETRGFVSDVSLVIETLMPQQYFQVLDIKISQSNDV